MYWFMTYSSRLWVPSIIARGAVQLLQYCSSISFVGQQGRLFRASQSRQSTQTRVKSSASTLTYLVFVGLTHLIGTTVRGWSFNPPISRPP